MKSSTSKRSRVAAVKSAKPTERTLSIVEKVSVLMDVVKGDKPQSALISVLDDKDDNFIKAGLEYMVSRELQAMLGKQPQFRLKVYEKVPSEEVEEITAEVPLLDGKTMHTITGEGRRMVERVIKFTEWQPESDPRFSVPMLMKDLRDEYPYAQIAVERR